MAVQPDSTSQRMTESPLWSRRSITLAGRRRGFHLITDEVVAAWPELRAIDCGMAQLFIQHTTASLTVNENIAPAVLADFRSWFDEAVPEKRLYWTHTEEGPADMPAHIKTSMLGPSVLLPVGEGSLLFGQYQGIYLCEHVDTNAPRTIVLTAWGQPRASSGQSPSGAA